MQAFLESQPVRQSGAVLRKVEIRLPGKGNSNSHGARPVHQITSRLTIKISLSLSGALPPRGRGRCQPQQRSWPRCTPASRGSGAPCTRPPPPAARPTEMHEWNASLALVRCITSVRWLADATRTKLHGQQLIARTARRCTPASRGWGAPCTPPLPAAATHKKRI